MNRLEMAELIDQQVPILAEQNRKEWKHMEKLRRKFVSDFTIKKIQKLSLDEYVVGKGSNRSFCYRIERELDSLGRIIGTPAIKFGIYYGKSENRYLYAKRWGNNVEESFASVKQAIV